MNILRDYDQRSPIVAINGICATSQPLASQVGIDILKSGGNAADAAIAMAATLSLTEPFSTGLGGDCVVMFWNNKTKEISSINGIGRSPMNLTIDSLESKDKFGDQFHTKSVHAVTVPGAAAAWCDTIKQYGSGDLTLSQIFQPTIDYCEQGVPIQVKTSYNWK
ncbi:hypothetical protein PPL_11787 [Heterostelium album PN500]|uniref:Gamma-glutamyltransferase n=1 Tax=Heterostelium pallidum (strain ATCC 26659 / Pp 5 / PN500) TaxID=670386 RepID=D3BUG7_HETP5|nr:hypothetical protein PPL_11787 [Heterostelium album PN500]EFA74755.1 hypothetical protein PPL_11787 [Heterostelium album PN500]|eukprot:XP_020426889.1 hypothetical protein PPL_11787 [Heterostelium album PN500]